MGSTKDPRKLCSRLRGGAGEDREEGRAVNFVLKPQSVMSCDFNPLSIPTGIFQSLIFRYMQYVHPFFPRGAHFGAVPLFLTCLPLSHLGIELTVSFLWVCE